MSRYMIELEHEAGTYACAQAVQVFLATGSHFLTRADWGCLDGVHTAWMVVEADSREEARLVVPPAFRGQARITALNGFSSERIEELLQLHGPGSPTATRARVRREGGDGEGAAAHRGVAVPCSP